MTAHSKRKHMGRRVLRRLGFEPAVRRGTVMMVGCDINSVSEQAEGGNDVHRIKRRPVILWDTVTVDKQRLWHVVPMTTNRDEFVRVECRFDRYDGRRTRAHSWTMRRIVQLHPSYIPHARIIGELHPDSLAAVAAAVADGTITDLTETTGNRERCSLYDGVRHVWDADAAIVELRRRRRRTIARLEDCEPDEVVLVG